MRKVESVPLSLSDSLFKKLVNFFATWYDVTHPGYCKCDFSERLHAYSKSRFFSKLYKVNFNDFAQNYTLMCVRNACTNVLL